MTLTIHTQEDDQRQIAMTIEVDEKRVNKGMRKVAKQLAKQIRVPGFRPGKAPFNVVAQRFGSESIRAQAVEEMLNDVLVEALDQENIVPFARPQLDDMELDPTVLKLTVPLEPTVTLGDFRAIRKEIETPEITEEAVEEAIELIRDRNIQTEEVDRPTEAGDLVKISGKGAMAAKEDDEEGDDAENVIFDNADGIEFLLDPETTFAGTSFVDSLIGVSVGDSKEFTITYPEDYEVSDFAGREANFAVEVLEVKSRSVPEIDDELAVTEGKESLEELREATREDLLKQAQDQLKSDTLDDWIADLREGATLVYPPGAIDQELDNNLENMKQQVTSYGWQWEDYLTSQEVTEDSLKDQWREDTVKNFENSLVLREFIGAERLSVGEDALNAKIDERMAQFGDDMDDSLRESLRQVLMGQDGLQQMANELMLDKAYERVTMILAGDAPDLDELEAAEAAAAEAAAAEDEAEDADEAAEEDAADSEAEAETEESADEAEESNDEAEGDED